MYQKHVPHIYPCCILQSYIVHTFETLHDWLIRRLAPYQSPRSLRLEHSTDELLRLLLHLPKDLGRVRELARRLRVRGERLPERGAAVLDVVCRLHVWAYMSEGEERARKRMGDARGRGTGARRSGAGGGS